MLLLEEIWRLAKKAGRRLGRRGQILLFVVVLSLGFSLVLVVNPSPTMRITFGTVVPLPVWAAFWFVTAVLCAVGAWSPRDRWAYGAAIGMVTVWAVQSFATWWPLHVSHWGWVTALIYAGFARILHVCSGWDEPLRPETAIDRGYPAAIVTADEQGRVTGWYGAAEDVFGWHTMEILGRPIADLMPARYAPAHAVALARLRETLRTGAGGRTIYGYGLHRDGHEVPISLYVKVADTGAGPVLSAVIQRARPYGLPYVMPERVAPEPGT